MRRRGRKGRRNECREHCDVFERWKMSFSSLYLWGVCVACWFELSQVRSHKVSYIMYINNAAGKLLQANANLRVTELPVEAVVGLLVHHWRGLIRLCCPPYCIRIARYYCDLPSFAPALCPSADRPPLSFPIDDYACPIARACLNEGTDWVSVFLSRLCYLSHHRLLKVRTFRMQAAR